MLQRLPKTLAQAKAVNPSQNRKHKKVTQKQ